RGHTHTLSGPWTLTFFEGPRPVLNSPHTLDRHVAATTAGRGRRGITRSGLAGPRRRRLPHARRRGLRFGHHAQAVLDAVGVAQPGIEVAGRRLGELDARRLVLALLVGRFDELVQALLRRVAAAVDGAAVALAVLEHLLHALDEVRALVGIECLGGPLGRLRLGRWQGGDAPALLLLLALAGGCRLGLALLLALLRLGLATGPLGGIAPFVGDALLFLALAGGGCLGLAGPRLLVRLPLGCCRSRGGIRLTLGLGLLACLLLLGPL